MLLMHGLSYGPALTRNTKERASVCQSDQVGLRPPRVTSHTILTRTRCCWWSYFSEHPLQLLLLLLLMELLPSRLISWWCKKFSSWSQGRKAPSGRKKRTCYHIHALHTQNGNNVCCLPIYSGRHVRWMYQPGSHRRKATQDFSSTFLLLRCMPLFFSREGFSRSFPSSTAKSNFVYYWRFINRSPLVGHFYFYFLVRKKNSQLPGFELTCWRVRRLRGYQQSYREEPKHSETETHLKQKQKRTLSNRLVGNIF